MTNPAAAEPLLVTARKAARGRGGPALLDTFDRFNRDLADAPALRKFLEQEPDGALRMQPRACAAKSTA